MLFLLFPVVVVVLGIAAVLFVARELLLRRPDVMQRGGSVVEDEPGDALRDNGTPRYVDSTARPTDAVPLHSADAEAQRA